MNILDNAGTIDVDPLSVFPTESEIEPQKVRGQAIEVEPDRPSPEIAALTSALYELQTSVHSLASELTEVQEIARGSREDARRAIAVVRSVENRISALESGTSRQWPSAAQASSLVGSVRNVLATIAGRGVGAALASAVKPTTASVNSAYEDDAPPR